MEIKPYNKNAKKHPQKQVEMIAESIKRFGMNQPIVIDKNGEIIVGHGRYLALQHLGWEVKPEWLLKLDDLTDAEVKAYRLADNKLNESDWDMDLVIEDLGELDEELAKITGFDMDLLIEPEERDDEVPEVPEEPQSKLGDLYELGEHRVLCGDSTKLEDVERLMDGKKADMVFTDPPYLMAFEGGINEKGEKSRTGASHSIIANDKLSREDGDKFLFDLCVSIRLLCRGPWYITFYRLGIDRLFNALDRSNMRWRNLVIWKKNNHNLSNSDYKSLYEPMIVGWDDDYVPIFYGWNDNHLWNGKRNEKDVWEIAVPSVWSIDKTKKNELHPTMKPVELISRAILNSSKRGGLVADIFLGSGSTLIAAEKTGRICYGMELDPKYIDVIVSRWCEYTGNDKIKKNGKEIVWQKAPQKAPIAKAA